MTSKLESTARTPCGNENFYNTELQDLWNQGLTEDITLQEIYTAFKQGQRFLPKDLNIKIAFSECDLDEREALRFHKCVWIPKYESLKKALIQNTQNSFITGHLGHDSTRATLSRNYFWPGASFMVRKFCQNYDVYGPPPFRKMGKRAFFSHNQSSSVFILNFR